jgi:hypothetical protein
VIQCDNKITIRMSMKRISIYIEKNNVHIDAKLPRNFPIL